MGIHEGTVEHARCSFAPAWSPLVRSAMVLVALLVTAGACVPPPEDNPGALPVPSAW